MGGWRVSNFCSQKYGPEENYPELCTGDFIICGDKVWEMFSGEWRGVWGKMWCDKLWCDVVWCDMISCDVMWCDGKWSDVMWYDEMRWDDMWCVVKWMWLHRMERVELSGIGLNHMLQDRIDVQQCSVQYIIYFHYTTDDVMLSYLNGSKSYHPHYHKRCSVGIVLF